MDFEYDSTLSKLLSEMEELFVIETPKLVAELKVAEPAYAVFLWYSDSSSADGFAPEIGVGTQSVRLICSKSYDERSSVNDCIWRPQQATAERLPQGRFKDQEFIAKCNDAYSLMLAANTSGLPLEDEGDLLLPFRSMLHRVARRLCDFGWSAILQPTDDFVFVSLDRIGYWLNADLQSSLPRAKYELLQSRGLLP